jgi:Ca-activated chloride channel family protein
MKNSLKSLILLVLLLIAVSSTGLCSANAAAPGSNLVLIFDASGSMWGQIDGEAKITIAKEVMEGIIKDLPDDINVGLTVYGHRRKGDCDDLETIIPLGPINKQAFIEKIKAINPKGKTPMLRSIRLTAESIKHLEDETTILLVSDGKETCDPEPCAFVAELKALGINFVMHVVGFDVGGETEEELKCMADAGEGEYFPASNADKLKEALTTVIEKTVEKNLKVSALLNGKPLAVQVVILNPQNGEEVKIGQSTEKRPASFGLPPGMYDVKVIDAWVQDSHPHKMFKAVEVTKNDVTEITAKFGAGRLEISPIKEGKLFSAAVEVKNSNGREFRDNSTETRTASFDLEEGAYTVTVRDAWGSDAVIDLGEVAILPGQTVKKEAVFQSGFLQVFPMKQGKLFSAAVVIKTPQGEEKSDNSTESRPAKFEQLPGKYSVKVRDAWGSDAVIDLGEIEILDGRTTKKEVSFESGILEVSPIRNGKLFYAAVELTKPDGEVVRDDSTENAPSQFEVMPGFYSVEIRDDWGDKSKRTFKVEIKADETIRKTVDFDAPQAQSMAQPQAAADQLKQSGVVPQESPAQAVDQPNTTFTGAGVPPDVKTGVQSGTQVGARIDEDMIGAHVAGEDEEDPPLAKMPYNRDEWTLGRVYPLQARRNSDTLNRRLNSCEEQAGKQNRPDLLPRIQAARSQVEALNKLLKKKASKEAIQEALYNLAEEVMDIHNALAI